MHALCDSGAWMRGMALFRAGQVRRLEVVPLDDHWMLEGEVQGTQPMPYDVSVEMGLMPNGEVDFWQGHCTCPVGRQCKHGVALMAQAAHQGAPGQALRAQASRPGRAAARPAVRQEVQGRIAEVHRLEAEAQLVNWLLALERAGDSAVVQAGSDQDERPEQYLYLLSVVGAPRTAARLQLEAVVSYPKVTGGWSKPKPLRTPPAKGQAVYDRATEGDRQVLQLLRAMPHSQAYYSAYSAAPCAVIEGQVGLMAVQQAAATGRLYADAGGSTVGMALRWGEPMPLSWDWHEAPAPRGGAAAWALRARLPSPTATLCLNTPAVYLDAVRGLCGPVQAEGLTPAQLEVLLKAPPFAIEALRSRQADVAQRLGAAVPLPPVLQDLQRLGGIVPRACLHLAPTPAAGVPQHGLITARLRFDYQGHCGWWAPGQPAVLLDGAGGRVLLQRDLAAERDAIARLQALGMESLGEDGHFGIPGKQPQQAWMEWADHGFTELRAAGFALTSDPALDGWIAHAPAIAVRLEPQGGDEATSPWFALSLGVEIDGRRHDILPWLPDLIAAAAAQPADPATGLPTLPTHVYLHAPGGQGFVRLPTDALRPWMAALLELVGERAHDFTQGSLKLSRLEALRTSAALGEGVAWDGADTLRALALQLQGRAALPEVPVPAAVHADLRPYQRQGLNWLQFLRAHGLAGILADDMGLGKTLQTLAHIQVEKDAGRLTAPALIIAPVSLMGNWQRETGRFCPGLRSLVLHGKDRHALAQSMAEYDIVIAPYSLLQRDRERWLAAQWHLVVLDEAQNIKNASTHAAQVAGSLQACHRLCLSGTPMENHLGEVWSLFHFLMPGFLGSQQRFKVLFRTPIEKQGDGERLAQLRARVTPFMLRRTKALVAHELPPKVETVMPVELTGAQADLYETIRLGMEKTVRQALVSKGLARSQVTILDALLKLRQVCCDPRLVPLDAARQVMASAKLEQLMELLPEMLAEGRRVLLFSQFTGMLSLIEAELKQRGLPWVKLTGQSQKRDALIEDFTSGRVPLFLISLKAGGVGLNLPQADTVIHYDPWWNPAVETQATDRAHRIGQTQSVWVVKLVAQGTIEERILALQERKAQLAGSIYSGAAGRKEPLFTEGDLAELLKPLS
ncbi:MAG: helicase SNF2 [Burkholderiales bacterium RIFCSPHIGHO2_12_FULL_65_48]|nr:MAG: helicase SNF2 [Burkholderiales bacterium RIFCSPHIGHO2_12_FULL_65_48]